jgi:hypothetical protein
MPRYLSSHNMACMTRQGAKELAERLRAAQEVKFLRLLANLTEGQLIGEFEASSRQVIEEWFMRSNIHYEWLRRIDLEATRDAFHDH